MIAALPLLLTVALHLLHLLQVNGRWRRNFGSGIRRQRPVDNELDSQIRKIERNDDVDPQPLSGIGNEDGDDAGDDKHITTISR